MKYLYSVFLFSLLGFSAMAGNFTHIVIKKNAHPAVHSAAVILAVKLNIPSSAIVEKANVSIPAEGEIVMDYGKASPAQLKFTGKDPHTVELDGYLIKFDGNKALVFGKRPRSLLYAAGDYHWWKDKNNGLYVRQPSFQHRNCNIRGEDNIAELVAYTGVNVLLVNGMAKSEYVTLQDKFPQLFNLLPKDEQDRLLKNKQRVTEAGRHYAKLCHDADVEFYPFLYGNDMMRWSPELLKVIYRVFPETKGVRAASSWEKASLCPSSPKTREIIDAYIDECAKTYNGDGFFVTFWDWYGLYCQCDRCKASGMNTFSSELEKCLDEYYKTMEKLHKPVIIRTWASGVGHWSNLTSGDGTTEYQWVHAPGYGGFSGSPQDVWGKVIDKVPAPVTMQIKAYYSDCFPDARYNPLIGQTGNHRAIVEYQMTGQTTGRYYFPAVNVDHTSRTMKKNAGLVGQNGGVSLFWGATGQTGYDPFKDMANSINLFAWKEFSWDVNADPDKVWKNWAESIYGKEAAPFIIQALKASEFAVNNTFSALGFGSDTNSGFPGNIYTREVRLMYTNRHYLPEYRKFLEPTLANIDSIIRQKEKVEQTIDTIKQLLEKAKPFLKPDQYSELATRFGWLGNVAAAYKELDVSYWRFRYLRHLFEMRATDPQQIKYIADSYDKIMAGAKTMFQFDPALQFSCYSGTLEEINRHHKISLGSPVGLMREIYAASRGYVEDIVGPDYLPSEWIRNEVIRPSESKKTEAKPVGSSEVQNRNEQPQK